MSPIPKITNPSPKSHHISKSIKCPYCNNTHCWRHGSYTRKGFYSKTSQNGWIIRTVQRFLCREVSCKHTFSVLPEDVLPYCRFFWKDFLSINRELNRGTSAYSIALKEWKLSPRIIYRVKGLICNVHTWLKQLCREASREATDNFEKLVKTALQTHSWFVFTRMWFHHIYPCRIGKILNPHNFGIDFP